MELGVQYRDSIFGGLMKALPRSDFQRFVKDHGGDHYYKEFKSWDHLVTLVYAQLSGAGSLRELEAGWNAQAHQHYHLGSGPVPRASLGRLNAAQPYTLFEALFHKLAAAAQIAAPGHRFRFKGKLLSFDASLIELSLSLFPRAHFANRKAAVKLHIGLDHGGYLPVFAAVAAPHASDAEFVRWQNLPPGSICVFDKGCVSFALLADLAQRGVFFVTRMKRHNRVRVCAAHPVRPGSGVGADETVQVLGEAARREGLPPLRRVTYVDAATGRRYVFLTNHLRLAARTIADLYKERWQIELFFKWIKQNLKIKSFLGATTNAVLTQIWIALCVYLLLAYLKFANKLACSMQQLLRLLHLNLFLRRDLLALLRGDPREPPPKWQQNQLVLV